jgi:hypothetical protein
LHVVGDNDLNPTLDAQLYSFAIEELVVDFRKQIVLLPNYLPWLGSGN